VDHHPGLIEIALIQKRRYSRRFFYLWANLIMLPWQKMKKESAGGGSGVLTSLL
jgi:hypothetical protein